MALNKPEQKTIFVIDDDPEVCNFFEALLSLEGFGILTETSGERALEILRSGSAYQIDLVLLDLMMPGYSGYELLKELQRPGYQNVSIFIVTARKLDSGTVEMLRSESNVREFWEKPVDPNELKRKIHIALGTVPKGFLW